MYWTELDSSYNFRFFYNSAMFLSHMASDKLVKAVHTLCEYFDNIEEPKMENLKSDNCNIKDILVIFIDLRRSIFLM